MTVLLNYTNLSYQSLSPWLLLWNTGLRPLSSLHVVVTTLQLQKLVCVFTRSNGTPVSGTRLNIHRSRWARRPTSIDWACRDSPETPAMHWPRTPTPAESATGCSSPLWTRTTTWVTLIAVTAGKAGGSTPARDRSSITMTTTPSGNRSLIRLYATSDIPACWWNSARN